MVQKIEYDMTKFMRKSGSNAVHGKMFKKPFLKTDFDFVTSQPNG